MGKDIPNYDLEKIPDSEIIKYLRIELGKANSYISELESLVKDSKIKLREAEDAKFKLSKDEKLALKKDKDLLELKSRNLNLNKENLRLKKDNMDLIIRLNKKQE